MGTTRRNVHRFLYLSGLHRVARHIHGTTGTIFLMHRVVERKHDTLAGNLSITTAYLERAIRHLLNDGIDIVSLDEAVQRLSSTHRVRAFAVLTFDDGYRDNIELALPILARYGVPATIFVPTGSPDRKLDAWWLRLERGIQERSSVSLDIPGLPNRIDLDGHEAKIAAYQLFEAFIARDIPGLRSMAEQLLPKHEVSDEALLADHFLGWDELRKIVSHPLLTIGAHTVTHDVLSRLDESDAFGEMTLSRARLQDELQRPVDHFAYPFGTAATCGPREFALAQRAGFRTAVTTRPGNISRRHLDSPTALPRFVLGGMREKLMDVVLDVSGGTVRNGKRGRRDVAAA